ncbi:MAG TPA: FHA domain-containing protein, partial [Polyangiaceae bacterium]|nr:FHA domain-containing protein [Polyangiaceae bacterium]
MPLVLVLDDRRVPVDRVLTIGADKGCDVVVSGLSAKHARLEPGDEWTVVRAESGEVTVNDVKVVDGEARALLPGDQILFGPAVAKVAYEETNVPMRTAELALAALNRVRTAPEIVVVAGSNIGARHELATEGESVRLGRGRDCDWTIEDDKLSRAHVRFVLRADRVLVRDLESARGTFMGSARL